ncbi:MAG: extracellular solute-binding protein [Clostridiales bacterium]|nr:extracellular solute-binding protein [Clostridiales bacterium]
MKKLVSLLLCLAMLLSLTSAFAEVNHPDYINYDSCLPIIKEGSDGEKITLKVAIAQDAVGGKWDDLWIKKFIEKYWNVNLEVEQIPAAGLTERVSLLFASGELPDLMINLGLTTSNIYMYGQEESQLLKLDEYMDETLTPNILRRFEEHPDSRLASTTPDGHIYTLPKLGESDDGTTLDRMSLNKAWLDACGLKEPTTLDEFVDMLRAFKEKDPGNVGAENVIPLGGGYEVPSQNPGWYILNALGFNTDSNTGDNNCSYGTLPALLDGEAVLPAGHPLYKTYLETMKTLYDEGLISKNFFLLDSTEITGEMLNGYIGVVPANRVDSYGVTNWTDWEALGAVTSETNPEAQWFKPVSTEMVGNFAVSAQTKYPELCMRIADYYFSDEARIAWIGPVDGSEEAMGYLGRTKVTTADSVASKPFDSSRFPKGIDNNWGYAVGCLTFFPKFGAVDMFDSILYYHKVYHEGEDADPSVLNPEFPDHYFRLSGLEKLSGILESGFPVIYYLNSDDTYRLTELSTIIDPYVKEQAARFINGDRSLDEFDAYLSELDAMGFQEYQAIYQKVWENYQKNN